MTETEGARVTQGMPMIFRGLLALFGVPWLGHGRLTEFVVFAGASLYASFLVILPNATEQSQATALLYWRGYGDYAPYPLVLYAALSGMGLLFNIRSLPFSRVLRFLGASLGIAILIWLWYSFWRVGVIATLGFTACNICLWIEFRVIILATANLPRPGAPGSMGS